MRCIASSSAPPVLGLLRPNATAEAHGGSALRIPQPARERARSAGEGANAVDEIVGIERKTQVRVGAGAEKMLRVVRHAWDVRDVENARLWRGVAKLVDRV